MSCCWMHMYKLSNYKFSKLLPQISVPFLTQDFSFSFFIINQNAGIYFDRWRAFHSRATLNVFSFLPVAPRDYVLESRMSAIARRCSWKKPRRQNLHYCPRDHLGNLGIHRSQSDFKIKRYGRAKGDTTRGARQRSYVSPFRERTCCSIICRFRRAQCISYTIVVPRCRRERSEGPRENKEI